MATDGGGTYGSWGGIDMVGSAEWALVNASATPDYTRDLDLGKLGLDEAAISAISDEKRAAGLRALGFEIPPNASDEMPDVNAVPESTDFAPGSILAEVVPDKVAERVLSVVWNLKG